MEALTKLISQHSPAFGGFLAVVFSLSAFLDYTIKPDLKTGLLRTLYPIPGNESGAPLRQTPYFYRLISNFFGIRAIGSFLVRSALITTGLLSILIALQAIISRDDFLKVTYPFLKELGRPDGRYILIAASVYFIDIISIYQTLIFLRISRGCTNFFEFAFVAIADFLLSITLFIIAFPLFVTFAFFPAEPKNNVYLIISSSPTAQANRMSAREIAELMVFASPFRGRPTEQRNESDDQNGAKWFLREYAVSMHPGATNDITLKRAFADAWKIGRIRLQTKGNISDVKVIETLVSIVEKIPTVKSVRIVEKSEGFFTATALIELSATSNVEYKHFWSTYAGMLRQINFMDEQFFQIVALRSPSVSQNGVAFRYNMSASISESENEYRNQYISCDDNISVIERQNAEKSIKDFERCATAVAFDSLGLGNIVSATRYLIEDSSSVPISPFALSSLTATFIIYYFLISRIIFSYTRALAVTLLENGEYLLKRHLFLMTSCLLVVLMFPALVFLSHLK